ncbi:MAG: hypothetical protein K2Y13_09175 [Burkholderiaceae bacterium]|uniref:Uncharacterized protein n=1 Tax=Herminiimonas contaminans TaxID=1111140 RepID=A0ABS0EP13_9BURK|nr:MULTISPECIES: hypothetical protein [Oxalobacteraceae]MBF8176595.1 hypothetical protein [Herminiimonas contaminans]MBX9799617.1 hypothetical protein [Burkholderiaceae bacterium]
MEHANNSHIFRLFLAALSLVVFTTAAAVMIVAWISAVPEAYAVDLGQSQVLTPYMVWHQSWHYSASLYDPLALAYCTK